MKRFLSILVLMAATMSVAGAASPSGTFTLLGNYIVTGDFYVDSLLGHSGECLEEQDFNGHGQIVSTGSPCSGGGGGGVSSVTSDTALALTASPTTGAVHIAIPTDPIFGGTVTVGALHSSGDVEVGGNLSLPTIVTAQCLAVDGSQHVVGTGSPCLQFIPFGIGAGNSNPLPAGGPNTVSVHPYGFNPPLNVPVGTIIHELNLACAAYNATDAGGSSQYNPLDANGLGGYTIGFAVVNATFSVSAPNVLGSVILPTSPQAGPWVTNVTAALGSPYTVQSGDSIYTDVESPDGIATQWVAACTAYYN